MDEQLNILIVDDQRALAESLQIAIEVIDSSITVSIALSGKEALEKLRKEEFDIIVIDLEMPEMDGIELCKRIKRAYKGLKIIVLSVNKRPEIIQSLYLDIKTDAYLPKHAGLKEIKQAIQDVAIGKRYISKELSPLLYVDVPLRSLSKREYEVFEKLAKGISAPKVAEQLFISKHTVHKHKENIRKKLGVNTISEITKMYLESKLLPSDSKEELAPFKRVD